MVTVQKKTMLKIKTLKTMTFTWKFCYCFFSVIINGKSRMFLVPIFVFCTKQLLCFITQPYERQIYLLFSKHSIIHCVIELLELFVYMYL